MVEECTRLLRMIGRAGMLGERQLKVAMGLAIEGTIGFYGRSTAIGWEACEEIEHVRAEVLKQRGYTSGTCRAQIHADRDAGGLDHRHAYQHAAAVLVDEIERALDAGPSTPAGMAVEAHMKATCVRLGWLGRGDVRDWWPTHLESVLSEESIGEAWLLAKLRSGLRGHTGEGAGARDTREGPPMWEADERPGWRAADTLPCRVRVGLARTGGVAARVTPAGRGCEFTTRMKRIAAAGVRTWADITHARGRWLRWEEARARFTTLRDTDRSAYDALVGELGEARWAQVRQQWWEMVETDEWQAWAAARSAEYADEREGTIARITAARRTADCVGGWQVLVTWEGDWTPSWESLPHLMSGGKGLTQGQKRQLERCRKQPVPHSLHARITRDAGDGQWAWAAARAGNVRISAGEVERAVTGDLQQPRTTRALMVMWRLLEKHAEEVGGGEARARAVNMNETPRAVPTAPARSRTRTLYKGVAGKKKEPRRVALATAEEVREAPHMEHVTDGVVDRRVALQAWLDGQERDERALPDTQVHEHVAYEGTERVWRHEGGAGYGMVERRDLRVDPIMRLLMRQYGFEAGVTEVRTHDGGRVSMDAEEQRVLGHGGGKDEEARQTAARKECAQVGAVATGLHMVHHFTDGWAVDGSKKKAAVGRVRQTRVACGAYEGAVPVAPAAGESDDEEALRSVGRGMIGMRLPACYEVVDAELHAILLALTETASRGGAAGRRCLIMCDCLSALEMVEDAWRKGVRWHGPGTGRAAMLHAINEVRARLGLVVMMWVPAHVGVSANAYVDAVAKTYLDGPTTRRATSMVTEHLPAGKRVYTAPTPDGHAYWPETRFTAMRDAMGWWVRKQEVEQREHVVDATRVGPAWDSRTPTRWDDVWAGTGARTRSTDTERQDDGGAAEDETLLDAAAAATACGRKKRAKRKQHVTGEQMSDDRTRCGVAMAARGGALWEGGSHATKQGCPACCSRARGWGWVGQQGGGCAWQRATEHAVQADLLHVLCGECQGLDGDARKAGRDAIARSLRTARREVTRNGPRGAGPAVAEGRDALVHLITNAQKMLAKRARRACHGEREARRAWLAGTCR